MYIIEARRRGRKGWSEVRHPHGGFVFPYGVLSDAIREAKKVPLSEVRIVKEGGSTAVWKKRKKMTRVQRSR